MLATTAQLSAWQRCFGLSRGSLRSVWVAFLHLTHLLILNDLKMFHHLCEGFEITWKSHEKHGMR